MDTVIAWITSAPTSTDVQSKVIASDKVSIKDNTRPSVTKTIQDKISTAKLSLPFTMSTLDPWMELNNPLKRSSSNEGRQQQQHR
ncbi:hypothetical protein Pmani_029657 [Petrolisthes manimaculis]|uniref:Uncharacterized protein n=1 Tax=Petrolisthes manimaculis TaxID=1843537 RepID=A0AAE1NZ47_9EUCA|nr:hypothetical protein Pmani_029657 [Petrolisthes manimaculis]